MIHCVLPWYRINVRYFNFYGSSLPRTIFLGYEKEGLKALPQTKKRPVAVLGETRPVYPDKGCVGEVLGSVYLPPRFSQDGSMELMINKCHETLSHPAVSRCFADSLVR